MLDRLGTLWLAFSLYIQWTRNTQNLRIFIFTIFWLICANNDKLILTYQLISSGLVRLSQIFLNYVPINCICLHPFKNSVVVGSWDKSIRIFDIDSKEQKAKVNIHFSLKEVYFYYSIIQIWMTSMNGKKN